VKLEAKPDFSNVVIIPMDDADLRTMKKGAMAIGKLQLELGKVQARIDAETMKLREAEDRLRQTHCLHGLDQISVEQEVAIRFEKPPPGRQAGPPREQLATGSTNGAVEDPELGKKKS